MDSATFTTVTCSLDFFGYDSSPRRTHTAQFWFSVLSVLPHLDQCFPTSIGAQLKIVFSFCHVPFLVVFPSYTLVDLLIFMALLKAVCASQLADKDIFYQRL